MRRPTGRPLPPAWPRRQRELAAACRVGPLDVATVRRVVGVDCAFSDGGRRIHAAAVVWDVAGRRAVETRSVTLACEVPYVPGFLSFREGPAVHMVLDAVETPADAVIFDGQGRAHPRRCGLAVHVGVERDAIAVGCAKSRLCGGHDEPDAAGGSVPLVHDGEEVGRVVRTRVGVRPVFVSVGHRCDLASAEALVLACRTRYRLPEPTRLADRAVALAKA